MEQPALRRIAPLMLLVVVSLCASPAFAGKRARAKRQFNTAEKYYKVGQFQKAIEHYTRAYELVPLAPLLFNLGQCHKQLGNCERAVFYYETFLRESPDAANAPLASELLDECRQTLAATAAPVEEATDEPPPEEATGEPSEEESTESPPEPSVSAASLEDPVVAQPTEPGAAFLNPMTVPPAAVTTENESSVFSRWWFWTIVGTVAAAGGVTTYVLLSREDAGTVPPSGSLGTIDTRR
jgi:hypothetical protein